MTTRTWLPEDYLDETVPPGRSDPTDWIKGPGEDGTFEMAPAFGDDDEGQPIKMKPGDIKSFYWCDPLGCVNVKVRRDGTFEVLGDVPPEQAKANREAGVAPHWGAGAPRHRTSIANWKKPERWERKAAAEGRVYKVFTSSLSDLFDNEVDKEWRREAWQVIKNTPNLRWIVLTKRVPNVKKMLPADWGDGYPNVGLVASVVTAAELVRDAPRLLAVSARWHGFSLEPQVERIVLPGYFAGHAGSIWIITGGDSSQPSSGIEPRPYDAAWARGLVTAGQVAPNVYVFVKQLGARPLNAPPQTDVYAGEKVEEWPEDIRVRNFPPELLR